MNSAALKFHVFAQNLLVNEEGQDLVEYALLVSLIALAAMAAVSSVASAITGVFSTVSTSLA